MGRLVGFLLDFCARAALVRHPIFSRLVQAGMPPRCVPRHLAATVLHDVLAVTCFVRAKRTKHADAAVFARVVAEPRKSNDFTSAAETAKATARTTIISAFGHTESTACD